MPMDTNHPNVRRLSELVSQLAWRYVTTHTPKEIEAALQDTAERNTACLRMFGTAQPVIPAEKSA